MALVKAGREAPDFSLTGLDGVRRSLPDLLRDGPALLAFFKVSCPTCQYTFPFLERLKGSKVNVVGISQDNQRQTEQFNREYGVTFSVLLDPAAEDYPASNAYGITHVPTLVWVEPDRKVALTSAGFVKADLEEIARRAGVAELFRKGERVEAFRAG